MKPQDYNLMSDLELHALCVFREARGEMLMGKRGVACNVRNRVDHPGWWGHNYHGVILCPYQYSSFNAPPRTHITDPNSSVWPEDNDADWLDSIEAAQMAQEPAVVYNDVTNGSFYYFSPPIKQPPPHWGAMLPTSSIGHLSFWRPAGCTTSAVST